MALATGLFPLLAADWVGADKGAVTTRCGGANHGVCKIFWLLPSGGPNKQVTKLGNADGLLIY